jgi:predicted DNA-binding transcriptional regulator AlpA
MTKNTEYITMSEAAKLLGVDRRTLQRHVSDSSVPVALCDRSGVMFRKSEIEQCRGVIIAGEGRVYNRASVSIAVKTDLAREVRNKPKTKTMLVPTIHFVGFDAEKGELEFHVFRNPRRGLTPAQRQLKDIIINLGGKVTLKMFIKDITPEGGVMSTTEIGHDGKQDKVLPADAAASSSEEDDGGFMPAGEEDDGGFAPADEEDDQ